MQKRHCKFMRDRFTQLSYNDRRIIYRGLCDKRSKKEIAIMLGRPISTVSREIKRNSDRYGYCYPDEAHKKAQERYNKNIAKITKNIVLKDYIMSKLKDKWSPGTIAGSWNLQKSGMSISKEAIYQLIYTLEGKKLELSNLLVRKHKKRGFKRRAGIAATIKNRVSIHKRPDVINQRIEPGHYECDLMFNSGSQSKNICVLIERVSRKAFLIKNNNKCSNTVVDALIQRITNSKLGVKSITFDNGSEFFDHHRFNDMKIDTYFCDPATPSQKGSVENFNGVLRRYLPFNLTANDITNEFVEYVENLPDQMPREILSFKTPLDEFKRYFPEYKVCESRVKHAQPASEANRFYQNNKIFAFHA